MTNRLRKKLQKSTFHKGLKVCVCVCIYYVGITLTEKKKTYKNFKMLRKEIDENIRRWKVLSCLWINR